MLCVSGGNLRRRIPFVASGLNLSMQGHGPLIAIICGLLALGALSVVLYCTVMEGRLDRTERARVVRSLRWRLRLAVALLLVSLPVFIFAVMGPP